MKRYLLLALMALLALACSVTPTSAGDDEPEDTTKQTYAVDYADEYNVYLELLWEESSPGACDLWYPYSIESFYVPLPDPGAPCTAPPQPNNSGVYNGGTVCDFLSSYGYYYAAWYEDLELEPSGAGGFLWITTEDEWGGFLCVLKYAITDVEPLAPLRQLGVPEQRRTVLDPIES